MACRRTAEVLPKDMTERQLRTHAMMLEYQTYSISELAERWGRTEDSIRKTAFRYHITKADDYQCKVRRKPVVRTSKRAAKVLEKRQNLRVITWLNIKKNYQKSEMKLLKKCWIEFLNLI